MYKCECGKEYESKQAFVAHEGSCAIHLGEDKYKELYRKRLPSIYHAQEVQKQQFKEQEEFRATTWVLEQHTCEHCGKLMAEKYGSGRFCCKSCANSHQKSDESKQKISNALTGTKHPAWKVIDRYNANPNKCMVCGESLPYETRTKKTCSNKCYHELLSMKAQARIAETGYNLKKTVRATYKYGTYKNIYCDSSWELAFIVYNLDKGINVQRNTQGFSYQYKNGMHQYFPDFIINDVYYEIKGYRDELVESKIQQFPHPLVVIGQKEIKPYIIYCNDTYGKDFADVLYDRNFPCFLDKLN